MLRTLGHDNGYGLRRPWPTWADVPMSFAFTILVVNGPKTVQFYIYDFYTILVVNGYKTV